MEEKEFDLIELLKSDEPIPDEMTNWLYREVGKGYQSYKEGRSRPIDEFFKELEKGYKSLQSEKLVSREEFKESLRDYI